MPGEISRAGRLRHAHSRVLYVLQVQEALLWRQEIMRWRNG